MGQGRQDEKLEGGIDGRKADVEGVPGRGEKMDRATPGSFARKLEWGGARVGTQLTCTGRGVFSDTG